MMIFTQYGIEVRITGFNTNTYPISVSVESVEEISRIKWVVNEYPLGNLKATNGYSEIVEAIKVVCPDTNYFNNDIVGGL